MLAFDIGHSVCFVHNYSPGRRGVEICSMLVNFKSSVSICSPVLILFLFLFCFTILPAYLVLQHFRKLNLLSQATFLLSTDDTFK